MKKTTQRHIAFVASVCFLVCACTQENAISRQIRGNYHFTTNEYYNDGIGCDVYVETRQHFGFRSMNSESQMKLNFKFSEAFEFSNIELIYNITTEGKWKYEDSILIVNVDTSAVAYSFEESNARTGIDTTMVRYLRKYVRNTFLPDLERQLLFVGADSICLDEVNDTTLVISFPVNGRTLYMQRDKDE